MVILSQRIHFFEINDEAWFPQFLREHVQSCLNRFWIFKVPLLQSSSPAQLVASTLHRVVGADIRNYTIVDFCAGAGGPTPVIEHDLNQKLDSAPRESHSNDRDSKGGQDVQFVLTDLHPHIQAWTKIAKRSKNITFISEPVDATNAPATLTGTQGKKVFRMYNLGFHHFDDGLASQILRNTLENSDGFGIFELQDRTFSSMVMMMGLGLLLFLITPFYFWRSPSHLLFTYIIPIIPFVVVFDGYISALRTRTPEEVETLLRGCGVSLDEWKLLSGTEQHTWPIGNMSWVIALKR
ncbi:unnamed protein product [Blumeria hordei]|uniref:Methyltransferase domain-containing protein n=2 Tax=Blumeria hordei TaxID=2867405 RepID=A0A383V077_BLUHO|nr:hypothetical protein BGHDH14_bgh03287 [Blumeria hordei DH14]SZF05547.1 unnamed protein product [Blumeria hordei]